MTRDASTQSAVLFAGGGTGGHLMPAVAIAEQLRELDPSIQIAFAISSRPADPTMLRAAIPPDWPEPTIAPIPAMPPSLRPLALARFALSWGKSVRESRSLIRSLPKNRAVLSLGGFVAPPVAQAARVERTPVAVLNIDAVPGKANAWVKRRAARALSVYDAGDPSWDRISPVVRASAIRTDAHECREELGLDAGTRTLLITGGSQGARTINDFALAFLTKHADALAGWQIIHQTGDGRDDIADAYAQAGVCAVCRPYFDGMGTCWGAATLALSRAGAGAVSEAWANRVPALFMPYPFHKDDHQRLNAAPLVEAGAAIVATDRITPENNLAEFAPALTGLLTSADELAALERGASSLAPPDGARSVAEAIISLLNEGRSA